MIGEILRTVLYVVPIIFMAFPFVGVHLFVEYKETEHTDNTFRGSKIIAKTMCILSVVLVIALTIGRNVQLDFNVHEKIHYINLKPFVQLFFYLYLMFMGNWHYAINIIGNILMFMPVGFFCCMYLKDCKYYKQVTMAVLIVFSLCIESFQILISRGFDVNDIILNTIGAFWGSDLFSYVSILKSDTFSLIQIRNKGRKKWARIILLLNWSIYVLCYYLLFFY